MSVYKEGFFIINQLNEKKKPIWLKEDRVYGVLTNKGDRIWNDVKQLVEWYRVRDIDTRKEWDKGVSEEIELLDEWAFSDGRKTEEQATERWKITYNIQSIIVQGTLKSYDGFITIERLK